MKLKHLTIYILLITVFLFSVEILQAQDKKIKPETKEEKVDNCIECHNYLTGRLQLPVMEWYTSVHYDNGVSCSDCHGGNPDIDDKDRSKLSRYKFIGKPKKKEAIEFCGREGCHIEQKLQFERGPHYKSVIEIGKPGCSTCHGDHPVLEATPDIIKDEACSECHTVAYSKEIIVSINDIEKGLSDVSLNIDILQKNKADVLDLQARLDRTSGLYRELLHIFSKVEILTTRKIVELEISNLKTESRSKVALTQRLDLLYLLTVGFCFLTISGFLIYSIYMYLRRKKIPDNI